MKNILLPTGKSLPAVGVGTWHMGESASMRVKEQESIRFAIDLGYRVFDTAEMYGEGGAETLLGQAISEALRSNVVARDQLFIVSKVFPNNANPARMISACDQSRKRLQLEHIDLYLLQWPSAHPLEETVAGFESLQSLGWIHDWGVSNFDTQNMQALRSVAGGEHCAINQVYYSVANRGPEFDLLPWQKRHSIPMMAYSPLDQGGLVNRSSLVEITERLSASSAQVALAWLISRQSVMVIPKSQDKSRLRENFEAVDLSHR